jgi:hypothetical protein
VHHDGWLSISVLTTSRGSSRQRVTSHTRKSDDDGRRKEECRGRCVNCFMYISIGRCMMSSHEGRLIPHADAASTPSDVHVSTLPVIMTVMARCYGPLRARHCPVSVDNKEHPETVSTPAPPVAHTVQYQTTLERQQQRKSPY